MFPYSHKCNKTFLAKNELAIAEEVSADQIMTNTVEHVATPSSSHPSAEKFIHPFVQHLPIEDCFHTAVGQLLELPEDAEPPPLPRQGILQSWETRHSTGQWQGCSRDILDELD